MYTHGEHRDCEFAIAKCLHLSHGCPHPSTTHTNARPFATLPQKTRAPSVRPFALVVPHIRDCKTGKRFDMFLPKTVWYSETVTSESSTGLEHGQVYLSRSCCSRRYSLRRRRCSRLWWWLLHRFSAHSRRLWLSQCHLSALSQRCHSQLSLTSCRYSKQGSTPLFLVSFSFSPHFLSFPPGFFPKEKPVSLS